MERAAVGGHGTRGESECCSEELAAWVEHGLLEFSHPGAINNEHALLSYQSSLGTRGSCPGSGGKEK